MNSQDKQEFKQIVREGTLEALKSEDAKQAIVGALKSDDGKLAIVAALKTPEAKEVFLDYFVEGFKDVVQPALEEHDKRITRLEERTGITINQ